MEIECIIFDMDGVVVDSEPLIEKADFILLQRRGIIPSKEGYEKIKKVVAGRRLNDSWSYKKEYFKLNENLDDLISERREIFFNLIDSEIQLMKGFVEFVEDVKKKYKLALTTSARLDYIKKLENKFSFLKYFNCVVTGDDIEKGKPDPESYIVTCNKLKVKPDQAVVIEDAPAGIKSAKSAGCKCIGVTFTFPEDDLKEADYIAHNYEEVKKIIKAIK